MMEEHQELIYSKVGSVARIVLNRPEKRNALNEELIRSLKAALLAADADEELSAVVISGEGKDFCAGLDLSALRKISESSVTENLNDAKHLAELFKIIRQVRVPVIAAVKGRAFAGGCGLASACDIVLASRTARFGYPEVKIGFVPAIVTAILRRNISEKRAFELLTRGEEISADEAERIGLVNRVFDDDVFEVEVQNYGAVYEKLSRSAVMLTKRNLYQTDGLNFESAIDTGALVNTIARQTADLKRGIEKFLKRN